MPGVAPNTMFVCIHTHIFTYVLQLEGLANGILCALNHIKIEENRATISSYVVYLHNLCHGK